MGRVSYKVKGTFVQFGITPEDVECMPVVGRPSWDDVAKELQIGEVPPHPDALELDTASCMHCGAYSMATAEEDFIPSTPSPLMHPAVLPEGLPDVMPFGADAGLPPAFDSMGENYHLFESLAGMVDTDMQDMCIPAMAYDPVCGWCSGWCVPLPEGCGAEPLGQDATWECLQEYLGAAQQDGLTEEQLQHQQELLQEQPALAPQVGHDFSGQEPEGSPRSGDSASGRQPHEEGLRSSQSKGSSKAERRPSQYTTVMLRNVPNKYTREMLVEQLNQDFRGRFDFVYLPIDFKNGCSIGYGFVNFRTVGACSEFVQAFDGVDISKCLPGLHSRKVAKVTPARVQGLEENVRRLRSSPVMGELIRHPEWMPLCLGEDGEEQPFPQSEQPVPPVKSSGRASRGAWAGGAGAEGGRRGGRRR